MSETKKKKKERKRDRKISNMQQWNKNVLSRVYLGLHYTAHEIYRDAPVSFVFEKILIN